MANVWKIAPGSKADIWDEVRDQGCTTINWLNRTDLTKFKTKDDLKAELKKKTDGGGGANSIWHFVHDVKPGDTVVANQGLSRIVGIGVVKSDYLPPNDPKNPRRKAEYHLHTHLVNWLIQTPADLNVKIFPGTIPPTVLPLDSEQCRKIKEAYLGMYPANQYPELKDQLDKLLGNQDGSDPKSAPGDHMTSLQDALKQFGQIILYGPPGTGKTREARRLALTLLSGEEPATTETSQEIEEKLSEFRDKDQFDLVVFHPAYEYEQFVGGIEPTVTAERQMAFETKEGVFLRLCRAVEKSKLPAVLIIDEINRGNLPKLLGELVYALEYRDHKVRLQFTCDERTDLVVPKKLSIIGTMNSSDRSIGHIDVAIRRRFGLYHLPPDSSVIKDAWSNAGDASFGKQLANLMDQLNKTLGDGSNPSGEAELGVGHSYFLPTPGSSKKDAKAQVQMKWEYQVQPLLREYAQLLNLDLQQYFKTELDQVLAEP